jgi:hypothetical protein
LLVAENDDAGAAARNHGTLASAGPACVRVVVQLVDRPLNANTEANSPMSKPVALSVLELYVRSLKRMYPGRTQTYAHSARRADVHVLGRERRTRQNTANRVATTGAKEKRMVVIVGG